MILSFQSSFLRTLGDETSSFGHHRTQTRVSLHVGTLVEMFNFWKISFIEIKSLDLGQGKTPH